MSVFSRGRQGALTPPTPSDRKIQSLDGCCVGKNKARFIPCQENTGQPGVFSFFWLGLVNTIKNIYPAADSHKTQICVNLINSRPYNAFWTNTPCEQLFNFLQVQGDITALNHTWRTSFGQGNCSIDWDYKNTTTVFCELTRFSSKNRTWW